MTADLPCFGEQCFQERKVIHNKN